MKQKYLKTLNVQMKSPILPKFVELLLHLFVIQICILKKEERNLTKLVHLDGSKQTNEDVCPILVP